MPPACTTPPAFEDVALQDNSCSFHSFRPSAQAGGATWEHREVTGTQKKSPNDHFKRCGLVSMEYGFGPACALEGLFEALSLVSCPIALYPALAANERISFRQVNKQTGNRLRHQLVDAVTGEQVQSHDKARGYEVGENKFLLVQDEELKAAEQDARHRPYSTVPSRPPAQENVSKTIELFVPAPSSRTTLPTDTKGQEDAAKSARTERPKPEPLSSNLKRTLFPLRRQSMIARFSWITSSRKRKSIHAI